MKKILVSACLAGCKCRYDGEAQTEDYIFELVKSNCAICVCPEQSGGLDTPRDPSERIGDRVVSIHGVDVTEEFTLGAYEALNIAQEMEIEMAILKSESPSCGKGTIYDGTFTGKLVKGNGLTCEVLMEHGIQVMDEKEGRVWFQSLERKKG